MNSTIYFGKQKRQVKVRKDESINIQICRQQVFFCGPIIKTRKHANPGKRGPCRQEGTGIAERGRLQPHLVGPQAPPSGSHTGGRAVTGGQLPQDLRPQGRGPSPPIPTLGRRPGTHRPPPWNRETAASSRWPRPAVGGALAQVLGSLRAPPPPHPILGVLQVSSLPFPRLS